MFTVFVVIFVILSFVCIVLLVSSLLKKKQTSTGIHSYQDIRQKIIGQTVETKESSWATQRPGNLDTRIDLSIARMMRAFNPDNPGKRKQRVKLAKLFDLVADSIYKELDEIGGEPFPVDLLSEQRRNVFTVLRFEREVNNGGFDQWYLNLSGSTAVYAPEALRALGLESTARLVDQANAVFPDSHPPRNRSDRLAQMDDMNEADASLWESLSNQFYISQVDCEPAMIRYILENESQFFTSTK